MATLKISLHVSVKEHSKDLRIFKEYSKRYSKDLRKVIEKSVYLGMLQERDEIFKPLAHEIYSRLPPGYIYGFEIAKGERTILGLETLSCEEIKGLISYFEKMDFVDHCIYFKGLLKEIHGEDFIFSKLKDPLKPLTEESLNLMKHISPNPIVNIIINDDFKSFIKEVQNDIKKRSIKPTDLPYHLRSYFSSQPSYLEVAFFFNAEKIYRIIGLQYQDYNEAEILNAIRKDNLSVFVGMQIEFTPRYFEEVHYFDSWKIYKYVRNTYNISCMPVVIKYKSIMGYNLQALFYQSKLTNYAVINEVLRLSHFPGDTSWIKKYKRRDAEEILKKDQNYLSQLKPNDNFLEDVTIKSTPNIIKLIENAERNLKTKFNFKYTKVICADTANEEELTFWMNRNVRSCDFLRKAIPRNYNFIDYWAVFNISTLFLDHADFSDIDDLAMLAIILAMALKYEEFGKFAKAMAPIHMTKYNTLICFIGLMFTENTDVTQFMVFFERKEFYPLITLKNNSQEKILMKVIEACKYDLFGQLVENGIKLENESSDGYIDVSLIHHMKKSKIVFQSVKESNLKMHISAVDFQSLYKNADWSIKKFILQQYDDTKLLDLSDLKIPSKNILEIEDFSRFLIRSFADPKIMSHYYSHGGNPLPLHYCEAFKHKLYDIIDLLKEKNIKPPEVIIRMETQEELNLGIRCGLLISPFSVGVPIPESITDLDAFQKQNIRIDEGNYIKYIFLESSSLDISFYEEVLKRYKQNTYPTTHRFDQYPYLISCLKNKNVEKLKIIQRFGYKIPDLLEAALESKDEEVIKIFCSLVEKPSHDLDIEMLIKNYSYDIIDILLNTGYPIKRMRKAFIVLDPEEIDFFEKHNIPYNRNYMETILKQKKYDLLEQHLKRGVKLMQYEYQCINDINTLHILMKYIDYYEVKKNVNPNVWKEIIDDVQRVFDKEFPNVSFDQRFLKEISGKSKLNELMGYSEIYKVSQSVVNY